MSRHSVVIPSASRLMNSLRDIGYDLPSAVADLIDNSLDAGARTVSVDLGSDWRGSYLRVADDGVGMTERQLEEAMRYGSRRAYGHADLGHFGLGLKTASLSQCRRLTVAARTTTQGRIRIRRWDLDNIAEHDAWVLERLGVRDCSPRLVEPLRAGVGTVVLWEKLDRVLGVRRPDGDAAQRRMSVVADDLRLHLGMVFHRFLTGEADQDAVTILLDGEPIPPWDPFVREERLTHALPVQVLTFDGAGRSVKVRVAPYVLPAQHHFSSPEAHVRAGGPHRWNRQQGLYIYRRDRLIQSGGWNRLRTMDEHSKLARIAVDLPADAEDLFRINVAKMTVGLPEPLRAQLRVLAAGVVSRAQDVYRQRVRLVPGNGQPEHDHFASPAFVLGDHWPMIMDVLEHELAEHPDLLDRVLLALVNARPRTDVKGITKRSEAAR